jgi:hypothetical protein
MEVQQSQKQLCQTKKGKRKKNLQKFFSLKVKIGQGRCCVKQELKRVRLSNKIIHVSNVMSLMSFFLLLS